MKFQAFMFKDSFYFGKSKIQLEDLLMVLCEDEVVAEAIKDAGFSNPLANLQNPFRS